MPSIEIAHICEQGQDMIIVPLDRSFGTKSNEQQHGAIAELQARSISAGLKGLIVPVWDAGGGRMGFIAPPNWHPFFKSIGLHRIMASVNRKLSW